MKVIYSLLVIVKSCVSGDPEFGPVLSKLPFDMEPAASKLITAVTGMSWQLVGYIVRHTLIMSEY